MRRFAAWRKARIAELAGPESWLGLVGLHPIEPGINPVGRGADCTVALPGGPDRAGELVAVGSIVEALGSSRTAVLQPKIVFKTGADVVGFSRI